jgi:putative dimethyl sulfoxide reductase chaperone
MHMNRTIARNTLYNVLATGFMYPEEHVCDWLLKGEWLEWMNGALHALGAQDAVGYCSVRKLFSNPDNRADNCLKMAREYTRLFITGIPSVVAPPYGSVYMDHTGLHGKSTTEVARFYQKAGFGLQQNVLEPQDHIGHELEFLGVLTAQEAEVREQGQDVSGLLALQEEFLGRFVLPWASHFCDLVSKSAKIALYAHLADVTKKLLSLEHASLYGKSTFQFFSQKMNQVEVTNGRICC